MNRFEKLQQSIDELADSTMADARSEYLSALDESRDVLRKYADQYGSLEEEVLRQNNALIALENELARAAESVRNQVSTLTTGMLRETYTVSYDDTAEIINAISDIDLNLQPSREVLEQVIDERISGMTLTERLSTNKKRFVDDVINTIESELKAGKTYSQMSSKLQERFEVDINSANRIVRTESHRVMESSKKKSVDDASQQGVEMLKWWLTAGDERVRSDHAMLGGIYNENNAIPTDELFEFEGMTAQYPGDWGVARMDINCRCIAAYKVGG